MTKILIVLMTMISSMSFGQVTVSWANYPGAVAVATDAANNVYTANWDYNAGGDITLTKRDIAGNIIWEVAYNNTDQTRHEVATWVATDHSGNILVSGTIRSGYSNPVNAASLLMKFNPSGSLLWRVVYESGFEGSSTKKCLVDANDNIYVLGIGTGPNGQVTKVKKFNTSGASLWNYFDAGIGGPVNFKFTPDNHIVISHRGITGSINGYSKIDLNGNNIWSLAGINSLTVGDAAGDAFGNTYIINGEYVTTNAGSIIKKISPTGTAIWSKTNTMQGNRVEVGKDNNPVVSGYPLVGYGAAFMKYDNNGDVLWQNLDADGPGLALLTHAQLRLDATNAAYLAASTLFQMAVCKINSNGTSAWTATTSGSGAYGLEFGTDNSVFVAGGNTARLIQGAVVIPAAPTNLTAVTNGTTINLAWVDNATNETNYIVQRSLVSNTSFITVATLAANSNAYANTGLANSTTYYYRVQSSISNSGSAWSNIASATTVALPPVVIPAAPGNLSVKASGCNQMNLTWTDNSNNEKGFEIGRSTSLNGTYTTVATVATNSTNYLNSGLSKNKRYYYMVRSFNPAGNSAWSNKANAVTTCNTSLKGSAQQQNIMLFPNPAVNEYTVKLSTSITLPVTLDIISVLGQKVYSKQINSYNTMIPTRGLAKGWYLVKVHDQGNVETLKLLVK